MLRPSNKRITGSLTAGDIAPGDHALAQPRNIPVVIVEAEKSALAIRAWAKRTRREILPIATGGCWSWRGRIAFELYPRRVAGGTWQLKAIENSSVLCGGKFD